MVAHNPQYSRDMVVIDDSNYTRWLNPVINGQRRGTGLNYLPPRPPRRGFAEFSRRFGVTLIPEAKWDGIIDAYQQSRSTIQHFCQDLQLHVLDQNGTNYCWVNGPTDCCRIVRLQETGRVVEYSPASAGARIKNFRNVGGWGKDALDWFRVHGLTTIDRWPANAIDRRYDTPENHAESKRHLTLEYFYLDTWAEVATVILSGFPVAVGYNWWSHEVNGCGIMLGSHDLLIRNSWSRNWSEDGYGVLKGSKKIPDDAVVITSMTPWGSAAHSSSLRSSSLRSEIAL